MVSGWEGLLERVRSAGSVPDMLAIVSEFDASLAELRERRSPLAILQFEYESMLARAEMQADHANIAKIRTALRVLDSAVAMESGSPSASRIDRIEVLLAWASESAPTIRAELDAYSDDARDLRAGDILRRAKSIENLVDLSMRGSRFAPGFAEFASSVEERLEAARNLVIAVRARRGRPEDPLAVRRVGDRLGRVRQGSVRGRGQRVQHRRAQAGRHTRTPGRAGRGGVELLQRRLCAPRGRVRAAARRGVRGRGLWQLCRRRVQGGRARRVPRGAPGPDRPAHHIRDRLRRRPRHVGAVGAP